MNVFVVIGPSGEPRGVYFHRNVAEDRLHSLTAKIVEVPLVPTHRHYKGGLYSYVGEGQQTEGIGRSAVYFGTDGQLWLRPPEMFTERVRPRDAQGKAKTIVPRFEPL